MCHSVHDAYRAVRVNAPAQQVQATISCGVMALAVPFAHKTCYKWISDRLEQKKAHELDVVAASKRISVHVEQA